MTERKKERHEMRWAKVFVPMLFFVTAQIFAGIGLPGEKPTDVKEVSWFFENGTGREVVVTVDGVAVCNLEGWDMTIVRVTPGSHVWEAKGIGQTMGRDGSGGQDG